MSVVMKLHYFFRNTFDDLIYSLPTNSSFIGAQLIILTGR